MTLRKLGELCEFRYGKGLPEAKRNRGNIPVYGSNGAVGFHSDGITDGPTIIIGRKGSIGEVNISDGACWPIDTTYYVDRQCTRHDIHWLAHALRTLRLSDLNKATGVPGLNRDDAYEREIWVPSLAEQKRIAAILDQADTVRRKRLAALERVNQLPQAIFNQMFGQTSLGATEWPTVKCSEVCSRITVGVVVKPASYYAETGVPALRGTNVKHDGFDLSDLVYFTKQAHETVLAKSRLRTGDLVIVRSGRPGLAAVVPDSLDGANAIDLIVATPNQNKVRSTFIREYINSPLGRAQVLAESRGQVQQHFNVGSFSNASILLPTIDAQLKFEARLHRVEALAFTAKEAANKLDALFASLQHRAFRGELTAKAAERELAGVG